MDPSIKPIIQLVKEAMQKTVEHLENELTKIRAGKAHPSMLDNVRIDYYGTQAPIAQVASVMVEDARTLKVQPFDRQHIAPIERAIRDANLGINPQNDGIVIRCTLPVLTEDRRKQLVKQVKEAAEEARIAARNIRREHNDQLKKKQKKENIAEDIIKAGEAEIQKLTDSTIMQIDTIIGKKEQEIMTV
jgi:ribosome recycling factor